jgi:hypothetical protein
MNSISIMISIMPDLRSLSHTLIREHPEGLESTGFRLEFIPIKIGAGKTILTGGGAYGQKNKRLCIDISLARRVC